MGIGYRELLILLPMIVLLIVGVLWLLVRWNRGPSSGGGQRSPAERLTELESLRTAGRISADEYEKQRASIISHI